MAGLLGPCQSRAMPAKRITMFDRIIRFSISNKLLIGVATLLVVVWGLYSLAHLPLDAVPDITNNQVQVITQSPALGAQEVEQYVTAPLELALAHVPGVQEKRSLSRSGISVITLVFKDDIDIYWARERVREGLKDAEGKIPGDLGQPSLGPVSTGLGEIYQYTLHPEKGYEARYSPRELRTLQDWIVRPQLAGIEGVAEVSSWGGYVKQYEVALDNARLQAANITLQEVFDALATNNANTGGGYIEQDHQAYFIRGLGQLKGLEDISQVLVKKVGGIAVRIGDIGRVQLGHAIRYGAVTRNGAGEVAGGIVLMRKGENFREVIDRVKARMDQVQQSLPEGVVIDPFVDRTRLVDRVKGTITVNLVEGALIVVLVLVVLMGSLRAGLVVASVIPLSMLIAFGMMHLTGVSANLMSLGAIDFGLIVDGAVIIVEAIVHRISGMGRGGGPQTLTRRQMDQAVYQAASKIRNSAAFGEIIILIVYLPLFALVGVEGKMFRPMVETVCFAIAGAFILSLTYVPVMSSWVMKRRVPQNQSISDRFMDWINRIYQPVLRAVLKRKRLTVATTVVLFGLSLMLFTRLGGEFIPTLQEGDLTVEISMHEGTALGTTTEVFSKAEAILMQQFPEIIQVVTRIGTSEVPTDPMPMERGDMMVAMQPKDRWVSARSKDEMVEKMGAALDVIPGIHVEITQPMQMRFNELMTGIRQDVAIKIFGEDLEVLAAEADHTARLIAPVRGVTDPYTEKVSGSPQIVVSYQSDRMAAYGLRVDELNRLIRGAFAGNVAGVVFEGEKRFDLVVRLGEEGRKDIDGVRALNIPLATGGWIPLTEVAEVSFLDAPAQISREDGKRSIYVGFNVRGRDVEGTVRDIKQILSEEQNLPPGYYRSFGGQFMHYQSAAGRLMLAVPVALLLIMVLLYFTLRSLNYALVIFTAVPLSAIGGIAALYIRGMPFSISAGVGFIALFGVAVLNGIVLVSYLTELKASGLSDIDERIAQGTRLRLRPVIMTAAVASLGFLPMALSGGAGAEVQRPLATVVIGGLITATILTLFVLPCLYALIEHRPGTRRLTGGTLGVLVLILGGCLLPGVSQAQALTTPRPVSLDSCVSQALRQNLGLKAASLRISREENLQKTAFDPGKTQIFLSQDATSGGNRDNALSVTQTIAWPGVYHNQGKVLKQQTMLAEKDRLTIVAEIVRDVRLQYYTYHYQAARLKVLQDLDKRYEDFAARAGLRHHKGESSPLEQLTISRERLENQARIHQAATALEISRLALGELMNDPRVRIGPEDSLTVLTRQATDSARVRDSHPLLEYWRQQESLAKAKVKLAQARFWPDITLGYSEQFLIDGFNPAHISREYTPGTTIGGFEVGVAVPLFSGSFRARVKAERIEKLLAATELETARRQLETFRRQAVNRYLQCEGLVTAYRNSVLPLAEEALRIRERAFEAGETDSVELLADQVQAAETWLGYLNAVSQLNEAVIRLAYLESR